MSKISNAFLFPFNGGVVKLKTLTNIACELKGCSNIRNVRKAKKHMSFS
jgi:hypothetical protein